MTARAAAAIAMLAAGAACGDPMPADRCEGVTAQALSVEARKLVGEASPYPADPLLRAREHELATSQRARREAAWAAVARVLEPVPLAVDVPVSAGPDSLPRWQTWYDAADLRRVFQRLWRGLPLETRQSYGPIPADALDAAFAWNPTALDELDTWPEERWQAYVDALDTAAELGGTGGLSRVAFAPGAARTLLAGYAQEIACLAGAPPAFVDAPAAPPTLTREPIELAACAERTLGPYFVAGGESLSARLDGGLVRITDDTGAVLCEADGVECVAPGGGVRHVTVASSGDPLRGTLVMAHAAPDAPWSACLDGRFAPDAAIIKADWQRADFDFEVPVHDTSAAGLAARLADPTWPGDAAGADPGAEAIYTVEASSGARYRLTALHLMTRELDHWLWVTLWWSPEPDRDFGADRPDAIDGVWAGYKMCAVTAFAEGDPDPAGGYAADHPDLAAALSAVHGGIGAPSWCSNPFLEEGAGNAATNCVGCHQHGGGGLTPEAILGDPSRFPAHGRTQTRNNFPADYAWSTERGDEIARMLQDEIEYWEGVE